MATIGRGPKIPQSAMAGASPARGSESSLSLKKNLNCFSSAFSPKIHLVYSEWTRRAAFPASKLRVS